MTAANSQRGNKLLAALGEHEYERLVPDLESVELTAGQVLHEPDQQINDSGEIKARVEAGGRRVRSGESLSSTQDSRA